MGYLALLKTTSQLSDLRSTLQVFILQSAEPGENSHCMHLYELYLTHSYLSPLTSNTSPTLRSRVLSLSTLLANRKQTLVSSSLSRG